MAKDYLFVFESEAWEIVKERRTELAKTMIRTGEVMINDEQFLIDMTGILKDLNGMIDLYISLQKNVEELASE